MVDTLTEAWHARTKDNYLQKFEVFIQWLEQRGEQFASDIDSLILLQFVLYLLREKVPTV